jgi:hypothetical protein
MRDPPTKNKQKIKEPTTKSLFHLLKIFCFTLFDQLGLRQFPDYSNTWRSLCEEYLRELVKKLVRRVISWVSQGRFGCYFTLVSGKFSYVRSRSS